MTRKRKDTLEVATGAGVFAPSGAPPSAHARIVPSGELAAREGQLFRALDTRGEGEIPLAALSDALVQTGLRLDDPRLKESMECLARFADEPCVSPTELREIIQPNLLLVERALQGSLVIPEWREFAQEIRAIYEATKQNEGGKVADYIPQLGRVSPDQFGVACCTIDGQRLAIGDAGVDFCVQSCTKPINYCLALEEHGQTEVHTYLGREPSGRGFNELSLNNDHKPHNPMINSGAIVTCSLLKPGLPIADRFDYVMGMWKNLAGGVKAGFSNSTYLSERQTADRNFALGYFMRENKCFPKNSELVETLEFYFQCCSIESTAESLAAVAGTLANGGVCPTTGQRVLQPGTVRDCLSLMYSCGMYDFSGEFAFTIGLPAKSGVAGALMIVVPNVMGLCTWSPRLDPLGNSVRGIDFCKRLVARFNLHNYDHLVGSLENKKDPRRRASDQRADSVTTLCWAASQGDLRGIQSLVARGIDLDSADYDGRSPLHLAAAEGHAHVVKSFVARGVQVNPVDRWGGTPLDDARRGGHAAVVELLEAAGAHSGARP
ncbi:MAG: glutaminase A [Myxococcales bacterium]|nr:glutaminase A [Myxococcales bacterium]